MVRMFNLSVCLKENAGHVGSSFVANCCISHQLQDRCLVSDKHIEKSTLVLSKNTTISWLLFLTNWIVTLTSNRWQSCTIWLSHLVIDYYKCQRQFCWQRMKESSWSVWNISTIHLTQSWNTDSCERQITDNHGLVS